MKLNSRTICPVEVRDKLIAKLAPIDNGISDMRLALETAEEKCFELDKEINMLKTGMDILKFELKNNQ